jgi:glycosyltransferase involved in cell wall biosynthesis
MHQTIVSRDAVGWDVTIMQKVLQTRGHQAYIFAENLDEHPPDNLVNLVRAEALIADTQVAVIYHHSIYWERGEILLSQARGPIAIKYHNITPPNYFADSPEYWGQCAAGREQTYRFATRFPQALWLPASRFNLAELGLDKVVPHIVVPPFIGVAEQAPPVNEDLLRRLIADTRLQLFFVSRFAPNKGHLFLVDVLREYVERFGPNVILNVAGVLSSGCKPYYDSVLSKIDAAGLTNNFRYLGALSDVDLMSYFMGSDVYLCCSEHEGFCVPIIEAQWLCLPVVARAAGAIPETAGGGEQAILGEDPKEYAAVLHRIHSDPEYRRSLIINGRRNFLSRFTQDQIEQQFFSALAELCSSQDVFA